MPTQLSNRLAPMYGHTISWPDERRKDHIKHQHSSLLSQTISWSIEWFIILSGTFLVSVLTCAIDIVSNFLLSLKSGHCKGIWYASRAICCMEQAECPQWQPWTLGPLLYIALSILLGLAAFLVVAIFPHVAMSGIPELKAFFDGFTMPNLMGNGPLISKSVALTLAVASGLWIGIEGPLIHLTTLCTNFMLTAAGGSYSEARKRDLILASSAGGLCIAFNAPLAGILFVFEVFRIQNRSVLWKGFVCSMVATVVYETIDPMRTGKQMFFQVSYDRVWHSAELIFFAILAVICGGLGALLTLLNGVYTRWRREKLFKWCAPVWQVTSLALATAILTLPNDLLSRSHQEFLRNLYMECKIYHTSGLCGENVVPQLIYSLIVSFTLTIVTYGIAVPAGIILPVLLTGAITGRIFGIAMQHFANSWELILNTSFCPAETECITPGVYALVGAAAALTGATKLTVSAVVLLFEMTGALSYIIPIMIGVMIAKWVSDVLGVASIYDMWMEIEGLPLSVNSASSAPVPNLCAYDVMKPLAQLNIAHLSDSIPQLRQLLRRNLFGFPVLNENNQLMGFITHKRLLRFLPKEDDGMFSLEDHLDPAEMYQLSSQASLLVVKNYMQKLGMHTLLFSDRSELQGLLTRIDLVRVLDRQQRGPPLLYREISYRQSLDRVLPEL